MANMRKMMYHMFPREGVECEKSYGFGFELLKVATGISLMDRDFDNFRTRLPDHTERLVDAKREFEVSVVENNVDFIPIGEADISILGSDGTVDFKFDLYYSHLDDNYNRVPFRGDTHLLRVTVLGGELIIQVHHEKGSHVTSGEELADLVVKWVREKA